MEQIYWIFGIVILLIIYYLYQKSENFVLQDPTLQNCLNKCNRSDVRMDGGHESVGACQRKCSV
jgi:hypothetical protein